MPCGNAVWDCYVGTPCRNAALPPQIPNSYPWTSLPYSAKPTSPPAPRKRRRPRKTPGGPRRSGSATRAPAPEHGFPLGMEKALALTGNQGIEPAMDWMMELIAQKQREREEREKRETIEREKQRRKQGQELSLLRQRLQEEEMRKLAEQRRRDRMEEKLARQRVREKIERDKAERAKKVSGKRGESRGKGSAEPPPAAAPSSPSQEPPSKREYDQCRIQVRLLDGSSLTQTFRAREQLAAVRLYVELHRSGAPEPFRLLTPFPRRVFTEDDMEKPLQELGAEP
uniref:UBX domain protein 1 n=1 Tax=Nothoprocta perdicaria TaxID=30464 RepID=A0A8C7EHK2_NOTPE